MRRGKKFGFQELLEWDTVFPQNYFNSTVWVLDHLTDI